MARRRKQLLPWILSGSLLVAALVLAALQIQEAQAPAPSVSSLSGVSSVPSIPVPKLPKPEPVPDTAAELFQEAKNNIREGKWTVAKARLLELQTIAPGMPGLKDYLERAEKEALNQQHLEAAQAALAAQLLDVAQAELSQVSADTTLSELLGRRKRELQAAIEDRDREVQTRSVSASDSQHGISDVTQAPAPKNPVRESHVPDAKRAGAIFRKALSAKAEGRWALAIQYAQLTLRADPQYLEATRLIDDLHQQAEQLVTWKGGDFRHDFNPEEMIPRYRAALDMTVPEDPLHEKVQHKLEQLAK